MQNQTAQNHAKMMNKNNITVLQSHFDTLSLEDESVDVVISNGAINLTSCKEAVFKEVHRVLKPNAKIYFADMINIAKANEASCCTVEKNSCSSETEDWANCVAGTLTQSKLIETLQSSGFKEVECTSHTHYTTSPTTQGATFKATKIASNILREHHWESLFQKIDYTQVLWHQNCVDKSLDFIAKYATPQSEIIDVGCGTSYLAEALITNNYNNLTLLDTSKTALEIVKNRLAKKRLSNRSIDFVCKDVLAFEASKKFDIWHDRAVFHFLQTQTEKENYFKVLHKSLHQGSTAIISTFQTGGEISCAGLDVVQYNKEIFEALLPDNLELIDCEEYIHITPKNSEQKYIYFVVRVC